jgi:hypothetical protein
MALSLEPVLDQERHLVGQADLDPGREIGGLAEVDQVFEREGQRDGLAQFNVDTQILLIDVGVGSQRDSAVADVAAAAELDTVLASVDCDCTGS